jgi:plastocyanin
MVSVSSKVALAIGISLSIAAISSIFVTMVAAQNLISSSTTSQTQQQQQQQPQPQSSQQNATTGGGGNNTSTTTSTIIIPVGAVEQNVQHYEPNPATVAPSSRVTWDNKDSVGHTATALDGSFDTGIIQPASSGSATMPAQGTIPYHCTIHPWMTATLQVSSSSSSPSASSAGGSLSSSLSLQQNGTGA